MSVHKQVKEITEQILQKQDTINDLLQSSKQIHKKIGILRQEIASLKEKRRQVMFSVFPKEMIKVE